MGGRSLQHLQLGHVLKTAKPKFAGGVKSAAYRLIGRFF